LKEAIISADDEAFWAHPGVDIRAIARPLFISVKEHKIVTGASTLTQQLVCMLVFTPEECSFRILRKPFQIVSKNPFGERRLMMLPDKHHVHMCLLHKIR